MSCSSELLNLREAMGTPTFAAGVRSEGGHVQTLPIDFAAFQTHCSWCPEVGMVSRNLVVWALTSGLAKLLVPPAHFSLWGTEGE